MRRATIVLLIGVAFAVFVFHSLLGNEPVKVSGQRMERSGATVDVAGKVENSGRDTEAITLEVHYYESQGRALGQDTVTIERLGAGQSRDFRSPKRDLPGAASFSIYLNHGRNPYGN